MHRWQMSSRPSRHLLPRSAQPVAPKSLRPRRCPRPGTGTGRTHGSPGRQSNRHRQWPDRCANWWRRSLLRQRVCTRSRSGGATHRYGLPAARCAIAGSAAKNAGSRRQTGAARRARMCAASTRSVQHSATSAFRRNNVCPPRPLSGRTQGDCRAEWRCRPHPPRGHRSRPGHRYTNGQCHGAPHNRTPPRHAAPSRRPMPNLALYRKPVHSSIQ
ncbi:hypothetical protein PFLmoz3_04421 [Pseudomonas fluorescens]|uniref:Uncharacterized protein n=1 Tax=Pseudomonas fluorescens TaxID=294 RepID=A0A109LE00_PSEFL|nr:hypothetical protein PFLmoz3_04421 [Pseudomonas fluorescens]